MFQWVTFITLLKCAIAIRWINLQYLVMCFFLGGLSFFGVKQFKILVAVLEVGLVKQHHFHPCPHYILIHLNTWTATDNNNKTTTTENINNNNNNNNNNNRITTWMSPQNERLQNMSRNVEKESERRYLHNLFQQILPIRPPQTTTPAMDDG